MSYIQVLSIVKNWIHWYSVTFSCLKLTLYSVNLYFADHFKGNASRIAVMLPRLSGGRIISYVVIYPSQLTPILLKKAWELIAIAKKVLVKAHSWHYPFWSKANHVSHQQQLSVNSVVKVDLIVHRLFVNSYIFDVAEQCNSVCSADEMPLARKDYTTSDPI
jgi:hypothetical protein